MKSRLIVSAFISVIIGIPILLVNLYALGSWEKFSRIEEFFTDGKPADSGPPGPLGDIGLSFYDMVEGHKERRKADAIFDPNTPTQHRRLSWNVHLTVDDVLKPGETRPDPELEPLYLLARAPALAMEVCTDMLGDMAKGCGFAGAEIKPNRAGMHKLELKIGFLPADPVGDTSHIATASLETEILSLAERVHDRQAVAPEDRAAVRAAFRQLARDDCAALREKVGSCVITALHINERPTTHGDGMWWLSATATLTWLKSDPTAEADLAALDSESSGLAGLLNSITGGGAAAAGPAEDSAPVVLNGGGAFKNASGNSRFQKVGE